jgi:hypothetical protein
MALGPGLLKKLLQRYEPSAMVELRHKGLDLTIKTNEQGDPILLFIGERSPDGKVMGKRYVRTLLHDADGRTIKDHWELKGPAGRN